MTEQQACTLCGAGGHTAAQCNWNQALELLEQASEQLWIGDRQCDLGEKIDTFLASQQGEQATSAEIARVHPEQADGAQGEREAFEAWCRTNEYETLQRLDGSGYNNPATVRAWSAWQARAALAQPSPPYDPKHCLACGGAHGNSGLPCPNMRVTAQAQPSPAQEPFAYGNADELEGMLNDRAATVSPNKNWYFSTPLYRAPVAQAGQVPDGFALVPLVATVEMLRAGSLSLGMEPLSDGSDGSYPITGQQSTIRQCYAAMLAAAPTQGGE